MMCERNWNAPPSLQQLHITITLIIAVNITSEISSSLSAHLGTNKVAFRPEPSPHPPSGHSQLELSSVDLQRVQFMHPILQKICGSSAAALSQLRPQLNSRSNVDFRLHTLLFKTLHADVSSHP